MEQARAFRAMIFRAHAVIYALVFAATLDAVAVEDAPSLVADRTAIERVYYHHRLGTKPPFDETLPPAQVERLVALELKKEAVLKRIYLIEITPALVDAEVRRIDATTRAPDVLAELKVALGNDSARFARSMARPIVVERTLRARFENDDKLHASERAKVEELRKRLLAENDATYERRVALIKSVEPGNAPEVTWQLAPRPSDERPAPGPTTPAVATENKASSGAYSIEATAQVAQVLSSPEKSAEARERTLYFEDLPPDLQNVLRTQLQKPGDVSAVIETPQGFLLYLAKERSSETLSVAVFSVPKRSYEEWLAKQPD